MSVEEFQTIFTDLLRQLKPGHDLPAPGLDTHLWESGHLDSIGMLEVVIFLENLTGREVDVRRDTLAGFFTIRGIYDTHVRPMEGAVHGFRAGEGESDVH